MQQHSAHQQYYTASTIKTIFCGLFLEYCSDLFYNIVPVLPKYQLAGGFLNEVGPDNQVSYEILLYLMIVISDNTATMIIYEALTKKLGDLATFLQKKFSLTETTIFDARINYDYALSTPNEFGKLLNYFLITSPQKEVLKKILSLQYVKGRGLRYIDDTSILLSGNKTGQLDDMINDS
ncbi:MAG: class A beta-lactamase-related serine hydrolase [Candidatus Peribacteria bacterium]|nr:class A beta-lactamase-related serine hydrolase [Candidatus Peribacteria bacterium]